MQLHLLKVMSRLHLGIFKKSCLYNDFMRKIEVVVDELIDANGQEKAFQLLLDDPELLRRY